MRRPSRPSVVRQCFEGRHRPIFLSTERYCQTRIHLPKRPRPNRMDTLMSPRNSLKSPGLRENARRTAAPARKLAAWTLFCLSLRSSPLIVELGLRLKVVGRDKTSQKSFGIDRGPAAKVRFQAIPTGFPPAPYRDDFAENSPQIIVARCRVLSIIQKGKVHVSKIGPTMRDDFVRNNPLKFHLS